MKTSEMFAMLEKNPKLTLVCRKCGTEYFMTTETVFSTYYKSYAKRDGQIITHKRGRFFGNISFDDDWQIVREPVPAWEAIKALSEGKSAQWHSDDDREILCFNKSNMPTWAVNLNIFFTGKWYINE